jgi:lipopolysaccharide biosynthesis regulator YciM
LAQVVREIDDRLRHDPRSLGEVYRSRGAVEEFLAVHKFLAINFAVDTERKFVLVRDCHALSRRPFK